MQISIQQAWDRAGDSAYLMMDADVTGPQTTLEVRAYVLSHFSRVQLCVTLWTVACQAPLSMRFSRKGYWIGLPCPPPKDLPY